MSADDQKYYNKLGTYNDYCQCQRCPCCGKLTKPQHPNVVFGNYCPICFTNPCMCSCKKQTAVPMPHGLTCGGTQ
jgi:hypothetical protein